MGPASVARQLIREPLGQAPRGSAEDLDDVGGGHRPARRGDAKVGEGGADAGVLRYLGAEHRLHGHAGVGQGNLGGEEQGVDPGQHGDGARLDPGLGQPALDGAAGRLGTVVGVVGDHGQRASGGIGLWSRG